MSNKNPWKLSSFEGSWSEKGRRRKSKLNKTIKLLLNCDALNLIRLIKTTERGEKVSRVFWEKEICKNFVLRLGLLTLERPGK